MENMPIGRLRSIASSLVADPGNRNTTLEWARSVALSEGSLRRLVYKETRMTFGKWRQQFKIMLAVQEHASGVSVESVSEALGNESASAFSLMFKKILGLPPRVYVKQSSGLT
jgi:AraC-like DNA-binding protein